MSKKYFVGSRKSNLARTQTQYVIDELKKAHPDAEFDIQYIETKGDKILDVALNKIGDKGLFTKELETMMLDGDIDFAVHSLKDVATDFPDNLTIGSICKRDDPNDIVIIRKDLIEKGLKSLDDLNNDKTATHTIGTSSIRRQSQVRNIYSNLRIKDLRGNIETRMNRLEDVELGYSAIILAYSGLQRMGEDYLKKITHVAPDNFFYAVSQGALAIQCRKDDSKVLDLIKSISDENTTICCTQERDLLKVLQVGCHAPLSVKTEIDDVIKEITMYARLLSEDGKQTIERNMTCLINDDLDIGKLIGNRLLEAGGKELLATFK